MTERAEFHRDRGQAWFFGLFFVGIGLTMALLPISATAPDPRSNVLFYAFTVVGPLGLGLWSLWGLRKTGVQLVVDRDGITDLRLMPDPIPWAQVERCALVTGMKGVRLLQLVLRPDSPAAARLGKARVMVNDLVLTGGMGPGSRGGGVRGAIARLAPQVPRDG